MQTINIITGIKAENGESELVRAYIQHFLGTAMINDEDEISNRELQKPVFVNCNISMNHRPVHNAIESLENNPSLLTLHADIALDNLSDYAHDVNYVKTKQELVDLIEKELSNDIDVHFFINNMDSIMGLDELHEICSKYPNDKTKYSADFTVEYTRRSSWIDKLEMEYKTLSNRIDSLSLFLNNTNTIIAVFDRMLLNSQLLMMNKLRSTLYRRLYGEDEIKVNDIVTVDVNEIITSGDKKFLESISDRELKVILIEDDADNPQTLKIYTCVYNDSNEVVSNSEGKPFPFYSADIKKVII